MSNIRGEFLNDFRNVFRRKTLRKSLKISENIAKNFRNVSFLGNKNRAKNRIVRRDYVAMQQDALLHNWAFF